MSRRILIVEPDRSGRLLMDRVLTAEGYSAEDYEAVLHAKLLLDDGAFDLAVVDEFGGSGGVLQEARFLRERYPRLPIVVTGTMLSAPVLLDLMRMGVTDALPKPFTPEQLREAVARAFARHGPAREESLEYDAAYAIALGEFLEGRPEGAARALARMHAVSPLDPEAMALEALRAELAGRDEIAARAYRASLALRHDEGTSPPDPYEGLARLAAYRGARPVAELEPRFADAPIWLVRDVDRELAGAPPDGVTEPYVVVVALRLTTRATPAVYLRAANDRAFALVCTDLRAERLAPLLPRIGNGRLVASDANTIDLARLEALRRGSSERARTSEPPARRDATRDA